jgi:hypothetical protein
MIHQDQTHLAYHFLNGLNDNYAVYKSYACSIDPPYNNLSEAVLAARNWMIPSSSQMALISVGSDSIKPITSASTTSVKVKSLGLHPDSTVYSDYHWSTLSPKEKKLVHIKRQRNRQKLDRVEVEEKHKHSKKDRAVKALVVDDDRSMSDSSSD